MPSPQPAWRRMFDQIEAAIGRPLEDAMSDPRVNELLMRGLEASKGMNRRWRGTTASLLHLRNLPSHSDVRRLERRLGAVEKQLLDLTAAVERLSASLEAK